METFKEIKFQSDKKYCLVDGVEANDEWLLKNFGFTHEVSQRDGVVLFRKSGDKPELIVYTDLSLQECFPYLISQYRYGNLIHGEVGKEEKQTLKIPASEKWFIKPYNQIDLDFPKWVYALSFWNLLKSI